MYAIAVAVVAVAGSMTTVVVCGYVYVCAFWGTHYSKYSILLPAASSYISSTLACWRCWRYILRRLKRLHSPSAPTCRARTHARRTNTLTYPYPLKSHATERRHNVNRIIYYSSVARCNRVHLNTGVPARSAPTADDDDVELTHKVEAAEATASRLVGDMHFARARASWRRYRGRSTSDNIHAYMHATQLHTVRLQSHVCECTVIAQVLHKTNPMNSERTGTRAQAGIDIIYSVRACVLEYRT